MSLKDTANFSNKCWCDLPKKHKSVHRIKIPSRSLDVDIVPYPGFPTYRPYQKESVGYILYAFKKGMSTVILDSNVGSGKTKVAMDVALNFTSPNIVKDGVDYEIVNEEGFPQHHKFWYMTLYNPLVDQVSKDYNIPFMKGRPQHICYVDSHYFDSAVSAPCTYDEQYQGRNSLTNEYNCEARADGICTYYNERERAMGFPRSVSNAKYFTALNKMDSIKARPLTIIDECHRLTDEITSALSVNVMEDDAQEIEFDFPYTDDKVSVKPTDWVHYERGKKVGPLVDMNNDIVASIEYIKEKAKDKEGDERHHVMRKMASLVNKSASIDRVVKQWDKGWVLRPTLRKDGVEFLPLYTGWYGKRFLDSFSPNRLCMSGTARRPDIFAHEWGIPPSEICYIEVVKSIIPTASRRVIIDTKSGQNMSGCTCYKGGKAGCERCQKRLPKAFEAAVKRIKNEFSRGNSGVIFPYSKKNQRDFLKFWEKTENEVNPSVEDDIPGSLIWARDANYAKEVFLSQRDRPRALLTTINEGHDMKGDIARFGVILKCPYPSLGDPLIKARMNAMNKESRGMGDGYYSRMACTTLQQMVGRVCRGPDDYGTTWVYDTAVYKLIKRNTEMFNPAFMEALYINDVPYGRRERANKGSFVIKV